MAVTGDAGTVRIDIEVNEAGALKDLLKVEAAAAAINRRMHKQNLLMRQSKDILDTALTKAFGNFLFI